jgi:integrase/recombinase XerD
MVALELIWATSSFKIAGHSHPGFPIILWDSMASCTPANEFLRASLLRGEIGSKRSWESTGRALYDFFSFLQAHDLHWQDVDRGEKKDLVTGYRDYCRDTCELATATIRQRVRYVCEFYEFSLTNKWTEKVPYNEIPRKIRSNSLDFGNRSTTSKIVLIKDVLPVLNKSLPRFLRMSEVKELLAQASNPHHRMMIRFALHTGLRQDEIASFPTEYVFNPEKGKTTSRNIQIRLDPRDGTGMRTKRSKVRDIFISRRFMSELYAYLTKMRGERASLRKPNAKEFFLNHVGEPYSDYGKSICRIIRNIGKKASISVSTHMLRHTYATQTLLSLQKNREIEPLVFLQRQLGHSSIQTTMVYLHLINALADEAVLAYDDELSDFCEAS